jgi:hypothetical protein
MKPQNYGFSGPRPSFWAFAGRTTPSTIPQRCVKLLLARYLLYVKEFRKLAVLFLTNRIWSPNHGSSL